VVGETAVSPQRTVVTEGSSEGHVIGGQWDSQLLQDRVKAVASVAHDRYLSGLSATDGRHSTPESVAAAKLEPDL
jgi:hypothetical protein